MDALHQVESILAALSPAEKAVLLRRVMDDLGDEIPGIERTADVCGGEARIAGTRIPVWLLERARRSGATSEDLLRAYPTLTPGDLERAHAYGQSHADEIDRLIDENEAA